jgi:transcriptional regulator
MPKSEADTSALSPFECYSTTDILALIDEYPLAWVVPHAGLTSPSLLPLLAETGANGELASLFGHMSRRNPLVRAFDDDATATILFTGPQACLPTALVSDPHWAPTWVYAQASITATLRFVPEETEDAVERLTKRIEGSSGTAWQPRMVGPRYDAMIDAIVAFRATVTAVAGRFKLGQDESVDRLEEIVGAVDQPDLVRWIVRFMKSH